jgi:cell division transport system permease protein
MIFFIKRAIQDILSNRFLHTVTIITIALSILIVSAFGLFFVNISNIMESWKEGVRIMAYLEKNTTNKQIAELKQKIIGMYGVQEASFISKDVALKQLKNQMKRQASLFENLKENPLPDAFETRMIPESRSWEQIETLAGKIEALSSVTDVEYGQPWLGRFINIFNLFRFAGFAMCIVFFMASVFIVANTIRLLFYSRSEEFEIMRLVGATDSFIKAPLYIEGLIQGAAGGIVGIIFLFIIYLFITLNVEQGSTLYVFHISFLSLKIIFGIILCSMFAGWLGCFLSLKQLATE